MVNFVKDAGILKEQKMLWVKNAGVWKEAGGGSYLPTFTPISKHSPALDSPFGATHDDGYLIISDTVLDRIYKVDANGAVVTSVAAPAASPSGLAWDGTNLISADLGSDRIYIHNGFSNLVQTWFTAPGVYVSGLGFDGTNLLSSDATSKLIYVHDGISSTILESFASPGTPAGLAFDGENLISIDTANRLIYVHDGISANIISTIVSPCANPRGLGWDGTNLFVVGASPEEIAVCEPTFRKI